MSSSIDDFDDFWGHYVRAHRSFFTQLLHTLGTLGCFVFLVACTTAGSLLAWHYFVFLVLSPLVGYGPAWISHFLIEKNKPVAFDYPLYSLRADLKMVAYFITGRMPAEVARFSTTSV